MKALTMIGAAALAGTAIATASPAAAELQAGSYKAMMGGADTGMRVQTHPCGADCFSIANVTPGGTGWVLDLRRQGNTWSGADGTRNISFDNDSLTGPWVTDGGTTFTITLVPN